MIRRSLLIWLSIIPIAILNGGLREKVIAPWIGKEWALPISSITLCILIFAISLIFIPRLGKGTKRTYITIGLIWSLLTIMFETIFALIEGHSFLEIIKAYDISTGNLWLIDVIFVGFVPWIVAKIRRII